MSKGEIGNDDQDHQVILDIIGAMKHQPGALLPILHAIQQALGFVPPDAQALIADGLNISRADVHGVVSFYHHFRSEKPGQHVIQVCRAESCQAMGSASLERHVKQMLSIDYHQTTADGSISLEPVYCLGNCACSPSIAIADDVYGDMDADKFDRLLEGLLGSSEKAGAA